MAVKTAPLLALALLVSVPADDELSAFRLALESAERALESGDHDGARALIERALERDRKSTDAWRMRARWAEAIGDTDELVYSLHQDYRLSVAQGLDRGELATKRERLVVIDPIAKDLLAMKERFLKKLLTVAEKYEKSERPHSAIRVHKEILALDPENAASRDAIERIAASPDPSLAGDAKPKDLFADVSDEWIAEYDALHATWDEAAEEERPNYVTVTDAGYEVLIRAAEAMEQMSAFYRVFFQYGTEEDGKSVPRIRVHIFKDRDEYLTLGAGPPVEWSGGHFIGWAVETYVGDSGFEGMVGTLFHEAAHQFVSLATNAVGWLNEGLASFFEGTRILPNGTVIMNMPANHRLFPLADRMDDGWMADANDGLDPADPNTTPTKAPTFRIVLENKYAWGPPWYAPTWGVVYFLYNYQDPFDGRFVYRSAFREFIDKSGGRQGEGAVENFEEVVLGSPSPPLKGVERPEDALDPPLPRTVEELDPVWKDWMLALRDEQQGNLEVVRPYRDWGRYAVAAKDYEMAKEHFEKGLVATPDDIELLREFADLLDEHFGNPDRATKLVLEAIYYLEQREERDEKKITDFERLLAKLDPKQRTLTKVHDEMAAAGRAIVQRYDAKDLSMMVMDVSWRLGTDLGLGDMFEHYERAVRRTGKSLAIWDLAYNEKNLDGWNSVGETFQPEGSFLDARFGEFADDRFDYQILTLDQVTSGDFSMEAEVQAAKGGVNFTGFVFGRKGASSFHGVLYFPGRTEVAEGTVDSGWVDLMSSYGGTDWKTWRHVPVQVENPDDRTSTAEWVKLRVDVIGRNVDVWFQDELVATQEYPSLEVLRGNFGLLCGPGTARFKNVRYLARDARDPAGAIERAIRMEELAKASGGAVGGSFQGLIPPFPKVSRWVQGERKSWDEMGNVPQLFVIFSLEQNQLVRIDEWLAKLHEDSEYFGLEIVAICSPNDDGSIDEYLADHPMPGAIGVDNRDYGTYGIGDSFEAFFIRRFNLPRVLLLDLDQTVAWEGDPGFESGIDPEPPYASFLDTPLEDLVDRRKLSRLRTWRRKWEKTMQPALHDGDLATAFDHLVEAREYDPRYAPEAGRAAAQLGAIEAALEELEGCGESFQREGADPALDALLEWAPLFDIEVGPKERKALKAYLESRASKDWQRTGQLCERFANKRGEVPEKIDGLISDLSALEGMFVAALVRDLEAARDSGAWAEIDLLVGGARSRPRVWLAREYFGW